MSTLVRVRSHQSITSVWSVRRRLLTAAVVLPALAVACGGDDDSSDRVEGIEWQLTSIDGTDVPNGVAPTLLLADDVASGTAGCNNFSGSYTSDGDKLSFGQFAVTLMACGPPADEVESAYLAALATVTEMSTDKDSLELKAEGGEVVLTYMAP